MKLIGGFLNTDEWQVYCAEYLHGGVGQGRGWQDKYVKFLYKLNDLGKEEAKLQMWGLVAKAECVTMDHAISLCVKADVQKNFVW